jgi:23S rRNA (uracil1939-C5)-methyltransferase
LGAEARLRPGQRLTVVCADIDDDGAGVGTPVGMPAGDEPGRARVHVAGALPGERVEATVEHVSAHRPEAWAKLARVEEPSPARRPPACAAFGACGGCVLQHLDYQAQLAWKTARVARALGERAVGGGVAVEPCVASPRPLGYRNRSKLVCARQGGRLVLGAYAPRSHAVVDLAGCKIVEPPLDDVARRLRDLLEDAGVAPYDERTGTGELRHVVLRASHAGRVLAVWVTAHPPGRALEEAARRFRAACPEVAGVVANVNRTRGNVIYGQGDDEADRVLDGAGVLDERVGDLALVLSPLAFSQTNREVAALAYAAVARAVAVRPGERAVDAYAGVGGIALTLARAAGEVIGIEEHAGAVADAQASAAANGIANARFRAGDVAAELRALDRADVVVLNPPRKGCEPAVLDEAARLGPRVIAYLSCDPDTLARDLALLAGRGYALRSVTPFDMLPHTPHVEALAVLDRR